MGIKCLYSKCATYVSNYFFLSSCGLLWLLGWEVIIHEDVPGEVQEVGELPSWRGPQTEDRAASTIVSTTHTSSWQGFIHRLPLDRFSVLLPSSKGAQSDLDDPDTPSFETMFQPAEAPSQKSYMTESPVQMGKSDDFSAPGTTES